MTPPIRHCGARVPDALRGNLAAGTCQLVVGTDGRHVGHHKATFSQGKLGKVTFRWATGWRHRRKPPPIVTLPAPLVEKKPILGRPGCQCPPWWSSHGHTAPCRL